MLYSGLKDGSGARRLIGAALLGFIFFLPLHQHFFTPTPQFTKECSCYQGARTQAGLGTALSDWTPAFHSSVVADCDSQVQNRLWGPRQAIRAPPSSQSF